MGVGIVQEQRPWVGQIEAPPIELEVLPADGAGK
jgi:hypothetical protein